MVDSASFRPSLVRAMVLLIGASFFAYLFAVAVHEFAHYLAAIILGVPEKGIVLHPFDLSYNIYGGDLSRAFGTPLRHAFHGASEPLLNMLLGVIVSLILWQKRSLRWLPVLMWGSMALHKPLFPILDRISHTHPAQVSWRDTLPAVGLGADIFVFQLVFFN